MTLERNTTNLRFKSQVTKQFFSSIINRNIYICTEFEIIFIFYDGCTSWDLITSIKIKIITILQFETFINISKINTNLTLYFTIGFFTIFQFVVDTYRFLEILLVAWSIFDRLCSSWNVSIAIFWIFTSQSLSIEDIFWNGPFLPLMASFSLESQWLSWFEFDLKCCFLHD